MTDRELGRALALLLLLAAVLVTPSLTLVAVDEARPPWWWQAPQLLGYGVVVAVTVRTVLTGRDLAAGHRLVWAVALVASLTAPWALAGTGAGLSGGGPGTTPPGSVPLVAQVAPIAAAACAAGWRGWRALVPAGVLALAQGAAHASLLARAGGPGAAWGAPVAQEAAFTLGVTMVSVLAIGAVRTSTDRLEATRAAARRDVVDTEMASSRRLARIRWAAAMHDDVLAVLRSVEAGRSPGPPDRAAAAGALATLRAQGDPQAWTTDGLADHLAHVVARVTPGAVTSAAATPGPVRGHVAEAVLASCVEAVRNVVRHARTDGRCHVDVAVAPDRIEVVVRDDGVGFAPARVPLGRLGLRVAVRDRMRSVGGSARWVSSPGAGTTVTLLWAAPGPAVPGPDARRRGHVRSLVRSRASRRPTWSSPAR